MFFHIWTAYVQVLQLHVFMSYMAVIGEMFCSDCFVRIRSKGKVQTNDPFRIKSKNEKIK